MVGGGWLTTFLQCSLFTITLSETGPGYWLDTVHIHCEFSWREFTSSIPAHNTANHLRIF